jgi:hypothetical protein
LGILPVLDVCTTSMEALRTLNGTVLAWVKTDPSLADKGKELQDATELFANKLKEVADFKNALEECEHDDRDDKDTKKRSFRFQKEKYKVRYESGNVPLKLASVIGGFLANCGTSSPAVADWCMSEFTTEGLGENSDAWTSPKVSQQASFQWRRQYMQSSMP